MRHQPPSGKVKTGNDAAGGVAAGFGPKNTPKPDGKRNGTVSRVNTDRSEYRPVDCERHRFETRPTTTTLFVDFSRPANADVTRGGKEEVAGQRNDGKSFIAVAGPVCGFHFSAERGSSTKTTRIPATAVRRKPFGRLVSLSVTGYHVPPVPAERAL